MSSYRIDLGDSNEDGIVLVTLSGRAQADSIVTLLDELNVLAGRDPALRVLIDETELGAGFVGAERYRPYRPGVEKCHRASSVTYRGVLHQSRDLRPEPDVSRPSRWGRAGERLQRPRTSEGLAP